MSGFCVHEWHQTTEEDLQQMAWGEDYWLYADTPPLRPLNRPMPAHRKREYAIHDKAIALAKDAGLVFHELPMPQQHRLMDAAEILIDANEGTPHAS